MYQFETEQRICEIGSVELGGQAGDYATVVVLSPFQKRGRVFEAAKQKKGEWPTKTSRRALEDDKKTIR